MKFKKLLLLVMTLCVTPLTSPVANAQGVQGLGFDCHAHCPD